MRHVLHRRPSPAMVVACIALIVALGGTSYAALKLPRNSVGNTQLRSNAVTSGKVRNGSLTAKDFRASALQRGPRGAQGPKGDSAPGAIPRAGFASRDAVTAGPAITVGAAPTDVIGLDVAAGAGGYVASSGRVTVDGPSRLIANGQALMVNAAAVPGSVGCRIALVATELRPIGNYVNTYLRPSTDFMPVAVSAGSNVDAGTYDIRLQCFSDQPAMQFHRGNLTVVIAPR